MGAAAPVASNATEDGRAKNRRVELFKQQACGFTTCHTPAAGIPRLVFCRSLSYPSSLKLREKTSMADNLTDLRQGKLDLLILKTIAPEPLHGWAIAQRIQQLSCDVLRVNQGSLYPALHRLERRGLVAADWRASDNNRRSKYYGLTAAGRKALVLEQRDWELFMGAVQRIVQSS
jgi:PadR family transcriptional regulator PadR